MTYGSNDTLDILPRIVVDLHITITSAARMHLASSKRQSTVGQRDIRHSHRAESVIRARSFIDASEAEETAVGLLAMSS